MTESRTPRVFVGTMFSGEAEFAECQAMVAAQQRVDAEQVVIRNLPEAEAHLALWEAWTGVKHQFDVFAKIDADTVLIDNHALWRIWSLFRDNARVTGAQILLHDFFTDGLIAGMSVFSPQVTFHKPRSRLHCDCVDTNHDIVLKGNAVAHLAPIALHCKYPHPVQAFHYGHHRALKKQTEVIRKVARAWRNDPAPGREWALAGAMSASFWRRRHTDYGDKAFMSAFDRLMADPGRTAKVEKFVAKVLKTEGNRLPAGESARHA